MDSEERHRQLKATCNPYATFEFFPEEATPETTAAIAHQIVRRLENPYATEHYFPPTEILPSTVTVAFQDKALSISPKFTNTKVSKRDFETGSRAIFYQYMPIGEKHALRQHHKDFIARNANLDSTTRSHLLQMLRRFDLSSAGHSAMFNRESDVFTERKLKDIERQVLGGDLGDEAD
jgi:hypothetical protein